MGLLSARATLLKHFFAHGAANGAEGQGRLWLRAGVSRWRLLAEPIGVNAFDLLLLTLPLCRLESALLPTKGVQTRFDAPRIHSGGV
jgi:hypothetical protein